uniref:prepilin peptidase n=1 Tax=Sandarakinorhabdus oryzae TaxID=2675220 RepID=UPI0012E25FD7
MPAFWWSVIGGWLGLAVGSFIALVTARWPQGQVITGRSRCDHCGVRLGALELVPLLSFLALRGRCRHCRQAISGRHWQVELAAAAVGAALLWRYPAPEGLLFALAGWWLLALLILDTEHQWLPDLLTLPFIPFALLLPGLALVQRLWGAGLGFAALWLVGFAYRRLRGRDGLGGGDPKLLAGLGALLGPWQLPLLITGAA